MMVVGDIVLYPDVLLFSAFTIIWGIAWNKRGKKVSQNKTQQAPANPDVQERTLTASVIGSFVTSGLTATSILIPASFVIIQIGLGNARVSPDSLRQVAISFYWFVFSIAVGIFNAARFP